MYIGYGKHVYNSHFSLIVSCSCTVDVNNDDRKITVCSGPSVAPCLCDYNGCMVGYNHNHCLYQSYLLYSVIIPLMLVMVMCVD